MTLLSSREFNQDTGKAKRLAEKEPVFITDRGAVSHVLLSVSEYERLASSGKNIADLLSMDDDIDFDPPRMGDIEFKPMEFD
ncbi:MAG: type II toxin-antitoxin system Phd/YefM family antitoxin [Rhizobium sp.]|nr:type II toxin-antitoxin system Phd/YefM family antitoxin [Rhizobium sp.]